MASTVSTFSCQNSKKNHIKRQHDEAISYYCDWVVCVFWKINNNMRNNYTSAIAPTISSWTQENFSVILDYTWVGSVLYGQLYWHSSKKECLEEERLHVETQPLSTLGSQCIYDHIWTGLESVESSFTSYLFIITLKVLW